MERQFLENKIESFDHEKLCWYLPLVELETNVLHIYEKFYYV